MTMPADEEALTPVELLLYHHFRHLDCPCVVDPVDTEDCAGMAVEVVRFLRGHGLLAAGGDADPLVALLARTTRALEDVLEWTDMLTGGHRLPPNLERDARKLGTRRPAGARRCEGGGDAMTTILDGPLAGHNPRVGNRALAKLCVRRGQGEWLHHLPVEPFTGEYTYAGLCAEFGCDHPQVCDFAWPEQDHRCYAIGEHAVHECCCGETRESA